uniref:Putative La1-like peptide n=1 Tax=Megacormus gertschi TaxID=1843536 RepID=A0A224X3N5_9SCOR
MKNALEGLLLGSLIICSFFHMSVGKGERCDVGQFSIPVGQQVQDFQTCTLYKCLNYNRKYALESLSCASQKLKSGCRSVPGAATAPFPNCCPTVSCKG